MTFDPSLCERLEQELIERMDAAALTLLHTGAKRARIADCATALLREHGVLLTASARAELLAAVADRMVGLGPIQPLLDDPTVTEIMVNGADRIFVERGGRLTPAAISFDDDEQLLGVIERILAPLGRRLDESSPIVDARLPNGSRVNAVTPPLALHGPALTIRKFPQRPFTPGDLVALGTLTGAIAAFLECCVRGGRNIVVSGGTGAGKTTTLGVLASFIPVDQRVITIEDTAELRLPHPNLVALEARPPNAEGRGEVEVRDLVRTALRMRPDRIVVGEVRGAEALDMLQAMNTGHEGCFSTVHANSVRGALSRLETMVLLAGAEVPLPAVRRQITSAVHLVVQQSRLPDGSRRLTEIAEVAGVTPGGEVATTPIFTWRQHGVDAVGNAIGAHLATGAVPECTAQLKERGIALPTGMFAA